MPHQGVPVRRRSPFARGVSHLRISALQGGEYVKNTIKAFLDQKAAEDETFATFYPQEGKVLHHCVFANSYYKRAESIILGARVNGRRTETIEVRTNPMMIVQCRGKYDQDSPYHKEIISLMSSSLGRLMERVKVI